MHPDGIISSNIDEIGCGSPIGKENFTYLSYAPVQTEKNNAPKGRVCALFFKVVQ
jgi:hypothetical protein